MQDRPQAVHLDARAREAFLRAFVAEVREERALSEETCLALRHRLEAMTEAQFIALRQAVGGWPAALVESRHAA